MKQWLNRYGARILWLLTALSAVLFVGLYCRHVMPAEGQFFFDSAPLEEKRDVYQLDTNIYDVYISAFPTVDENGDTLDLSAFALHKSLDHSYNPTLNCNIQILPEGQVPSSDLDLDQKNATIRVRGDSTRGDLYKSYKVCLDPETEPFFGQTNLNINKDYSDISKISTKLATDLLAEMEDVVSYRTYFMRLWIRDTSLPQEEQKFEYQGLYIELEQPNRTFLEERGLSSGKGISLYKARDFSFFPNDALRNVDDPKYSGEAFEKVLGIRESISHKKVLRMLDAVNDNTQNFKEVFTQYFNEENYLTWLAFNMLFNLEDILNHNFLLYSPDDSLSWYFIHWDFDTGLRFGSSESQIPISLRGIQKILMGRLHRRYFEIPGNIEKLDAKMQELLKTHITRENVTRLVEAYRPVVKKAVVLEPDRSRLMEFGYTPDELDTYLDNLYDGILHNYDVFRESSEYPFSGFVAKPVRTDSGAVKFAWDPFYSVKGLSISYDLRVYTDYNMENLVHEANDLDDTTYLLEEGLPNGTYYVLISGTDSEGREQISLEHVEGRENGLFYYKHGLYEFSLW